MATSDDLLPDPLKDFIFDLHDSVRNSQIPSEQVAFYAGVFPDLTSKVCMCRY
jgi:hypothetical protein